MENGLLSNNGHDGEVDVADTTEEYEVLGQREPRKSGQSAAPAANIGDASVTDDGLLEEDAGHDAPAIPAEPPQDPNLYFLRLPRPNLTKHDVAIEQLKIDFEHYKSQYEVIQAQLRIARAQKDEAYKETEQAREIFRQAKEEFERVLNLVNPMRDTQAGLRDQLKELRESGEGLEVRSEAELDQKLHDLQFRMTHDTISLNEEKQIMKQLKQLNAQRERVRQFEKVQIVLDQKKGETQELKARKADLEQELNGLRQDKDAAKSVFDDFRAAERRFAETIKELVSQRDEYRQLKDSKYEELRAARDARTAKMNEFRANRAFSQQVRSLVQAGQLDEARELCQQQMEVYHQKLATDPGWTQEYFHLWSQQRNTPADLADVNFDSKDAPKSKTAVKKQPPVEEGKNRAQMAIEAALKAAEEELNKARQHKQSASATSASRLGASLGEAPAPAASQPAPEPISAIPMKPAQTKPAAKPAPFKPATPAPRDVAAKLPPPPQFEEDTFVPPVLAAEPKLSEAEMKEKIREEQRQKALEAQQRKERRKAQADRRKQRAAQQKQKGQDDTTDAAETETDRDITGNKTTDDEGGQMSADDTAAATAAVPPPEAAPAAPAATPAGQPKKAKAKQEAKKKLPKHVASKVASRRKPQGFWEELVHDAKKYWKYLAAAAVVLLLSIIASILYQRQ